MDKDLIKALRCLASFDLVGACYMEKHNRDAKKREMYCGFADHGETIQCPYFQDEYSACFENGECGEWLNKIADILENQNSHIKELKERLKKYEESETPSLEDVICRKPQRQETYLRTGCH